MYCSVGINGLELNLFDSAGCISNPPFFKDLFSASTDAGVSGVDVVVEHRVCFMIAIGNSKCESAVPATNYPANNVLIPPRPTCLTYCNNNA